MRHFADQRMSLPVVQRRRPVLPDPGIGRDVEPIRLAAVQRVAFLVQHAQQVELAFPQPPRQEENEREQQASILDRV